jgi:hypothetical protein
MDFGASASTQIAWNERQGGKCRGQSGQQGAAQHVLLTFFHAIFQANTADAHLIPEFRAGSAK